MDLSSRSPAPHLAQGMAHPGKIPMCRPSLPPSATRRSRPEPTLTSATKARGLGIELPRDHRAVALFIGGTGDKKSYYLVGPYRNIAYALDAFDQRLDEGGQVDGYQPLYLGYHEVWSGSAIGRLGAAEVHDKSTLIYMSSATAWALATVRICRSASANGAIGWGCLMTLDPVGSGLLVRLSSRIPYHHPAPRSLYWINARPEPGLPPQLLAVD